MKAIYKDQWALDASICDTHRRFGSKWRVCRSIEWWAFEQGLNAQLSSKRHLMSYCLIKSHAQRTELAQAYLTHVSSFDFTFIPWFSAVSPVALSIHIMTHKVTWPECKAATRIWWCQENPAIRWALTKLDRRWQKFPYRTLLLPYSKKYGNTIVLLVCRGIQCIGQVM